MWSSIDSGKPWRCKICNDPRADLYIGYTVLSVCLINRGLRKKRPSQVWLRYCDGWTKPLFPFFENYRGQVPACFALFCSGSDGDSDCPDDRHFSA